MQDSGYNSSFSSTQNQTRSFTTQTSVQRRAPLTPVAPSNQPGLMGSLTAGSGRGGGNKAGTRGAGTGARGTTWGTGTDSDRNLGFGGGGGFGGQGSASAGGFGGRGGGNEEDKAIVCTCGDDARLLTVRKEGPNTG